MAKIKTYVSSQTYDTLLSMYYPDDTVKERTLEEVERLILQGHTVEYRFGDNMSTELDLEKFNTFVKPRFAEYTPVYINEIEMQNTLNNLTPEAINPFRDYATSPVAPVVNENIATPAVDLNTVKVATPTVNSKGEEIITLEEKVTEEKVEEPVKTETTTKKKR